MVEVAMRSVRDGRYTLTRNLLAGGTVKHVLNNTQEDHRVIRDWHEGSRISR